MKAMLLSGVLLVGAAHAHEVEPTHHADQARKSSGVLGRIDRMQASVRAKLKNVFNGDMKTDAAKVETSFQPTHHHRTSTPVHVRTAANRSASNSRTTTGTRPYPTQKQPSQFRPAQFRPAQFRPAQYRVTNPDESGSPRLPAVGSNPPSISQPARDFTDPHDFSMDAPPSVSRRSIRQGDSQFLDVSPLPIPTQPYPNQVPEVGRYDAYPNEPVERPSRLNGSQITATERAMQLTVENRELRRARDSALAENQRMRQSIQQNQVLLSRSNDAITMATTELQNAELANKTLREKIAVLEEEHKRYLIETDRMLSSLRDDLDEVLVNEINFNGK